MNSVCIAGRLTRDPETEIYNTNSGDMTVTKFTVAVRRRGQDDTADFFSVTAFGGLAETIDDYCRQGDQIIITGHLRYNSWVTDDGENRSAIEIICDNMDFGMRKQESSQVNNSRSGSGSKTRSGSGSKTRSGSGSKTRSGSGSKTRSVNRSHGARQNEGFMNVPDEVNEELPWT